MLLDALLAALPLAAALLDGLAAPLPVLVPVEGVPHAASSTNIATSVPIHLPFRTMLLAPFALD
jgi:hypothetical protein